MHRCRSPRGVRQPQATLFSSGFLSRLLSKRPFSRSVTLHSVMTLSFLARTHDGAVSRIYSSPFGAGLFFCGLGGGGHLPTRISTTSRTLISDIFPQTASLFEFFIRSILSHCASSKTPCVSLQMVKTDSFHYPLAPKNIPENKEINATRLRSAERHARINSRLQLTYICNYMQINMFFVIKLKSENKLITKVYHVQFFRKAFIKILSPTLTTPRLYYSLRDAQNSGSIWMLMDIHRICHEVSDLCAKSTPTKFGFVAWKFNSSV